MRMGPPAPSGNAGKGLGETRTDALMPQPETGKISYVHRLPCARLSPGAQHSNASTFMKFRLRLDVLHGCPRELDRRESPAALMRSLRPLGLCPRPLDSLDVATEDLALLPGALKMRPRSDAGL